MLGEGIGNRNADLVETAGIEPATFTNATRQPVSRNSKTSIGKKLTPTALRRVSPKGFYVQRKSVLPYRWAMLPVFRSKEIL